MGNCNGGAQLAEADNVFVVPEAGVSLPVRTVRRFGWKKDLPDYRDRMLVLHESKKKDQPASCDLRPQEHFAVYDQEDIGSCTANAICAIFHFEQIRQKIHAFAASRLYLYYCERKMEGTVQEDSGAMLRDGIKCCATLGLCPESMWEYDTKKFTEKPPSACFTEALKCKALEYAKVPQTLEDLKACLNAGYPFVFGFLVCKSFMTQEVARTGMMKLPQEDDYVLGGHAVSCFGYDDAKQCFIIRNSWGPRWGIDGYFYMPYVYMCHEQLCRDFWCIKVVEDTDFKTKKIEAPKI